MGGGLEYCYDGISHYGHDDIGVLRVQPGITLITPADYEQARNAFMKTCYLPGPIYYRLSKDEKKIIPGLDGYFELGHAKNIGNGKDLLIIAMGTVTNEAYDAIKDLANQGINATLMVIACIKPPPIDDLKEALSQFRLAVTVEAHYITGGLGSMVSEIIAESGIHCRLIRCGIENQMDGFVGSQQYLYNKYGISSKMITSRVTEAFQKIDPKR
jgi:transketolase